MGSICFFICIQFLFFPGLKMYFPNYKKTTVPPWVGPYDKINHSWLSHGWDFDQGTDLWPSCLTNDHVGSFLKMEVWRPLFWLFLFYVYYFLKMRYDLHVILYKLMVYQGLIVIHTAKGFGIVNKAEIKEIQPVHSRGDQPWVFFERDAAEAETPVLWPPHAKSWLIGKDSDAGRDWGQEEKGTTEDEMAGGHHWLNGREFKWTPGDGDGQGGLACSSSWGRKELDTTERLNWTALKCWIHTFLCCCVITTGSIG